MKLMRQALVLSCVLIGCQALAQLRASENWSLRITTPDATATYDPATKRALNSVKPPIKGEVSPDGLRIAHVKSIKVGSSSSTELFVSNIDANGKLSNERQITNGAANAMQPQWTPDSKQIVYVRGEGKFQQVYITSADEEKWTEKRASAGGIRSFNPRIAPDGTIAYLAERGRDGKALLVDLIVVTHNKPNAIVQNTPITEFAWSPDSTKIAYSTHGELINFDLTTKKSTTLTYQSVDERLYAHHAVALAWRPDGKAIAASIQFSGGRAFRAGEEPQPMFGEREVFIISVEGKAAWFEVGGPPQDLQWTRPGK